MSKSFIYDAHEQYFSEKIVLYVSILPCVEKNAKVSLFRGGSAGEEGTCTFKIDGNLNINDGANVEIITEQGSTAGGIKLNSSGSSLHVSQNAELLVKTQGAVTDARNPIYIAGGASLKVDSGAKLNVRAENTGTSTGATIYAGNTCSFIVAKDGTFDVQSDGTGAKYLIRIGTSAIFQFADAKRVNLQFNNKHANSRLIYMYGSAGQLIVDVQAVKSWFINDWEGDGNPMFDWSPMYSMTIKYNGANVTSATGKSPYAPTQANFIEYFRTQDFQRVLFEGIPDVAVSIDELSDNKSAANSHTITGVTNPGAYVKLTGDAAIPAGALTSYDANDTEKYHVMADAQGKYTFTLPDGKYLTAGNQVTAYSYLNGKSATMNTTVKDETAPDMPTLNAISDKAIVLSGGAEANATVTIYKKADKTILATGKADGNGHYSITVPVTERPIAPYISCYAVATDAAGNTSEHSADVIVTDTTEPNATPITQYATVGGTFTSQARDLLTDVYDNAGAGDDNLTYTITSQPDLSKVGYTTAQVTVRDRAGNMTVVAVPVFVKDAGTISNDQAMMKATDITIQLAEYPMNEAELNTLIRQRSNLKEDGTKVDLQINGCSILFICI